VRSRATSDAIARGSAGADASGGIVALTGSVAGGMVANDGNIGAPSSHEDLRTGRGESSSSACIAPTASSHSGQPHVP